MTRGKKVLTAAMAALLVALCWSAYAYHEEAVNQWLLEIATKGKPANGVDLYFVSSIDERTLRVRMTVLCKNRKQRREILDREPRIIQGFVNASQAPSFTASIVGRDLGSLRKHLIKVINGETTTPVKGVYLDRFFFN